MADEQWGESEERWAEEREMRYPLPLPKDGDRLFRTDTDPERAWLQKTFLPQSTYLTGYQWAADHLMRQIETIQKSHGDPELPSLPLGHWLVYPVYFLHRHALELALKDILRFMRDEANFNWSSADEVTLNSSHDPWVLWQIAKRWTTTFIHPDLSSNLLPFEAMLLEIHEQDPNAEAARYSVAKVKGKPKLISFENVAPLEMNTLHDNAAKMRNFIRWIWTLYEERLEEEARREWWDQHS